MHRKKESEREREREILAVWSPVQHHGGVHSWRKLKRAHDKRFPPELGINRLCVDVCMCGCSYVCANLFSALVRVPEHPHIHTSTHNRLMPNSGGNLLSCARFSLRQLCTPPWCWTGDHTAKISLSLSLSLSLSRTFSFCICVCTYMHGIIARLFDSAGPPVV
jgi:hypothetical protein